MTADTTKVHLRGVILALTYSQLREIGAELHAMCAEPDVRGVPVDAQDFVDLLHDWAEAQ